MRIFEKIIWEHKGTFQCDFILQELEKRPYIKSRFGEKKLIANSERDITRIFYVGLDKRKNNGVEFITNLNGDNLVSGFFQFNIKARIFILMWFLFISFILISTLILSVIIYDVFPAIVAFPPVGTLLLVFGIFILKKIERISDLEISDIKNEITDILIKVK